MKEINKITQTLMEGDGEQLVTLVTEALDQGRAAAEILNDDLIAGMDLIGEKMGSGEMFIPEVLMTAHAMGMGPREVEAVYAGMDRLPPVRPGGAPTGPVLAGVPARRPPWSGSAAGLSTAQQA